MNADGPKYDQSLGDFFDRAPTPASARIIDFPASSHNGAGGISFSDGHAEIRKWRDARTRPAPRYNNNLALNIPSANNEDMIWLADRTSAPNK